MTSRRIVFLPIVERELRLASRRRKTYRARMAAATVAAVLGVCAVVLFETFGARTGGLLLQTISFGLFFYCVIAGAQSTADCLSVEKREGTLGLLFLTRLKAYDVVLGKLVAHTLQILYLLVAICPVLALLMTFGGISGAEFTRIMLVLVNAVFFSASVGLLVSAIFRGYQAAVSYGGVFLVGLLAGPLIVAEALRSYGWFPDTTDWVQMVSPFSSFRWATSMSPTGASRFWQALLASHLVGWGLLVLASRILPLSLQEQGMVKGNGRRRTDAPHRSRRGAGELRARLLDQNPFGWLAGRSRLKPLWVWVFIAGVAVPVLWFSWDLKDPIRLLLMPAIAVSTLCALVLIFWIGSEASRRLAEERLHGTLEWLLSTPLSVQDIVRGQWLALRRQFAGPLCAVVAAQIAVFFMTLLADLDGTLFRTRAWYLSWVGLMLIFMADVIAIVWTGMWTGVTAKDLRKATSDAATRIALLPVLVFVILSAAGTALAYWNNTFIAVEIYVLVGILLGILNALFWGASSRLLLYRKMRRVATERYTKPALHPE